jgi:hypothetical protein
LLPFGRERRSLVATHSIKAPSVALARRLVEVGALLALLVGGPAGVTHAQDVPAATPFDATEDVIQSAAHCDRVVTVSRAAANEATAAADMHRGAANGRP